MARHKVKARRPAVKRTRPSRDSKSYKVTCAKCGKQTDVPFKPVQGKPVYCSTCFAKGAASEDSKLIQLQEELELLHWKVDRIMERLEIN